jgi:hypothetical protein
VFVFVLLYVLAVLFAYGAQRCFVGARGASGAGRLRWQARGLLMAAGAFAVLAVGFLTRSPALSIATGGLALAAGVGSLVLSARARRAAP